MASHGAEEDSGAAIVSLASLSPTLKKSRIDDDIFVGQAEKHTVLGVSAPKRHCPDISPVLNCQKTIMSVPDVTACAASECGSEVRNGLPVAPDCVIVRILKCLPLNQRLRAQLVCRRWQTLVNSNADMWTDCQRFVVGDPFGDRYGDVITGWLRVVLPRMGKHVRRLTLAAGVHHEHLTLLGLHCVNVKVLEVRTGMLNEHVHTLGIKFGANLEALSFQKIFNDQELVLEKLFHRSPKLRELRFGPQCEVIGMCLRSLPQDILEVLVLPKTEHLKFEWLYLVLSELINLKHLEIPGCELRTGEGLEELSDMRCLILRNVMAVPQVLCCVENMPCLTELDLARARQLDDQVIDAIGECKNLRILNLCGAREVSAQSITCLERCEYLEYLDLSKQDRINARATMNVCQQLKRLRVLAVETNGFPINTASYVANYLPWVEALACWTVDEQNLKQCAELVKSKPLLCRLRRLFVADAELPDSVEAEFTQGEPIVRLHYEYDFRALKPRWQDLPLAVPVAPRNPPGVRMRPMLGPVRGYQQPVLRSTGGPGIEIVEEESSDSDSNHPPPPPGSIPDDVESQPSIGSEEENVPPGDE